MYPLIRSLRGSNWSLEKHVRIMWTVGFEAEEGDAGAGE
jgi:hypothetical protein